MFDACPAFWSAGPCRADLSRRNPMKTEASEGWSDPASRFGNRRSGRKTHCPKPPADVFSPRQRKNKTTRTKL